MYQTYHFFFYRLSIFNDQCCGSSNFDYLLHFDKALIGHLNKR